MLLKLACFSKPRTKGDFEKAMKDAEVPKTTLNVLEKTGESLDAKQKKLEKQIADETENIHKFKREKNRKGAILCLKKIKLLQQQLDHLANLQSRVNEQGILLDSASITAATVSALKTGANALRDIQRKTSITDVDKTMEEINEQAGDLRIMEEAISRPIAALGDFDEDDLQVELEELEKLGAEENVVASSAPVQIPQKEKPVRANISETCAKVPVPVY